MAEIIISFFAVIGIIFLIIFIFEEICIKEISFPITMDISLLSEKEILDFFDILNYLEKSKAGNIITDNMKIIISKDSLKNEDILKKIMISNYYYKRIIKTDIKTRSQD